MPKILMPLALAAFATFANAQTAARNSVLATVHQFVDGFNDGFNKGDMKMMLGVRAAQTPILDEFPPHEWHGAGACAKWASDFDIDAKKNGGYNRRRRVRCRACEL